MEVLSSSSLPKGVYNPKAVVLHAALLHRACAHCGRFLAAATRRCLGRVAVPVWLIVLTDQLPVIGLVGFHPTNDLMGRTPLNPRLTAFLTYMSVRGISTPFGALFPTDRQVRTCSSAVRHSMSEDTAFDLHALGTPPALILSQDQTRQKMVKPVVHTTTITAVVSWSGSEPETHDAHVSW